MTVTQPRVAVLIPAHNAERTLPATLASLAANDLPHDIVIIDDGSRTPVENGLSLAPNIKVFRLDPNVGVTRAMNVGLAYILKQGYEYIARLDADDVALPARLALQVAFMDRNPEVAIVGSAARVVSESGETLFYLNYPTDFETIKTKLFYNSCFLHPSFMMRVSAVRACGGYDVNYPNAEDYELLRRYARHGKLANLSDYLINYTVSTGGLSLARRREQLRSRLRAQWTYRNFGNIHFYLGIGKTLAVWCLPVGLLMALKRRLPSYRARA